VIVDPLDSGFLQYVGGNPILENASRSAAVSVDVGVLVSYNFRSFPI
jgi:hypothetical protein